MTDFALQAENLAKHFRVPRAPRAAVADPRREPDSWRHDRFWALREVSFQVARGRTLGIIGLNGSGKSTLLKILSGVMTPDGGTIRAAGRLGALLELGAGFHPELSGLENVYLNGALLGLTTRDVNRLLPEIIAFAELERFMDMPVKHYSSGMAARLGFAVATRLSPEILLMDETFATGDARFQIKALEHVAWMRGRGHTMLIVSHNLDIVVELADEVLWLDHGRTRLHGPAREVLAEYRRSRVDNISAERMRSTLGIHSIFDEADPARATVRIEAAQWTVAPGTPGTAPREQFPESPSEIGIRMGEELLLHLVLAHPEPHPARVAVETAWARAGDNKVLAQSRAVVQLSQGATTRATLALGPWELIEGAWRGVLAVGPVHDDKALTPCRYFDRLPEAVTVRTLTPNPIELEVITPFQNRWTVRDDA